MRPNVTITEDALRDWGYLRLGKFLRVARVEFRANFPRANCDKVTKAELRAPHWVGRARATLLPRNGWYYGSRD